MKKPLFAAELKSFPPPEMAFDEGVLDLNDDLSVERLLEAYSFGIFPWPQEGLPTVWYCPMQRGVLDFADLHISKSLRKVYQKTKWRFTMNKAFKEVIHECARAPRPFQSGTWLNSRLIRAFNEFHRAGYAHSLEVWEESTLVGGIYGVYVAGVFAGESMFYKRDNASKCALLKLVEYLQSQGLTWMDIQMVTPVLARFGGKYISRQEFLDRVEESKLKAKPLDFKL